MVVEFKSDGMFALPFIYPPYETLFQSVNIISTNETRLLSGFHIFAAPERPLVGYGRTGGHWGNKAR